MADKGGKRGNEGNTKIWISWEQNLLDEIKCIFINFLRAIIFWSKRKADTSFNEPVIRKL